jgi:hypothetical protein
MNRAKNGTCRERAGCVVRADFCIQLEQAEQNGVNSGSAFWKFAGWNRFLRAFDYNYLPIPDDI